MASIDERDDPVADFSITLHGETNGKSRILHTFEDDVHSYGRDKSFKNFHVNLDQLLGKDGAAEGVQKLVMELAASTGTQLVGYRGVSTPGFEPAQADADSVGEIRVDLTPFLKRQVTGGPDFSLFYPFTTTFVEIRVDREPLPPEAENKVYRFLSLQ